jgi:hypothetical protein
MVLNADGLPALDESEAAESAEGLIVDFPEEEADALVTLKEDRPAAPIPVVRTGKHTNGMAIASVVMGIAGWTVLPFVGSILAIILGYVARREIRQRPDEFSGDGLAVVGLVLGWLMVGISIIALCLGLVGLCFFFGALSAGA